MNIEPLNAGNGTSPAGEVTLSQQAQILLDCYLAKVKSLARGLQSVSVQDVTTDVREHVFTSLRGKPGPVAALDMQAALQRVGAAEQWLPLDELPAWRRAARWVLASPHLPYAAFALLVVALMLPLELAVVLAGASFCLARAAVTQETPENHWQRWLIYPPLLLVYGVVLSLLLLWPFPAVIFFEQSGANSGWPQWLEHWIPRSPNSLAGISAAAATVGLWVALVGLILTIQPAVLRAAMHPFTAGITRRGTTMIVVVGMALAVLGKILMRW
jgi:hypothetical protein